MASEVTNHGGRALAFARERNMDYREVLDFSANINPLGPSPNAVTAIRDGLDLIAVYPDEMSSGLTRRLSERLHVRADCILPGNGAIELLYFWLRAVRPRSATLIVPTFSEYHRALKSAEVETAKVVLKPEDDFQLPLIDPGTDVVILTNPNNPSGAYAPPDFMRDWLRQIRPSAQILVDEAFVEFTAQPSLVRYIEEFPNLWVLRSMTKFYAIPGLRLGYLTAAGVPSIAHLREPWQVSNLAEVAGIASLDDAGYAEATMQLIQKERIWLWKQLHEIPRLKVFASSANFFLARCDTDATLNRLIAVLADRGILIRDCRSLDGLEGPYFRFAIKKRLDNIRLLDHLREVSGMGLKGV
jgi:threonine-phosphate decarboxylase